MSSVTLFNGCFHPATQHAFDMQYKVQRMFWHGLFPQIHTTLFERVFLIARFSNVSLVSAKQLLTFSL